MKDEFGSKIILNESKTIFSSKAHNRHVTGITINNNNNISLGRKRKKYIKHLVNEFRYKKLDQSDFNHLKGLLSFASHIEPTFIYSLKTKYSDIVINNILKGNNET